MTGHSKSSMDERRFWDLVSMMYCNATLTIRIAEMRESAPDHLIGRPLQVTEGSEQLALHFDNVTEFRSCAEPCFQYDGKPRNLASYLFECTGSEFLKTVCPFGIGAKEPARHFCVLTEGVVIEVLTNEEPRIELLAGVAKA